MMKHRIPLTPGAGPGGGEPTLPFGDYKGTPIKDLPDWLIARLLDNEDKQDEWLARALRAEWRRRGPGPAKT